MAHGSKKVVIVGAGFGGLETAKALNKRQFGDITIIDKTNHHLFQPLLYQVASAALSPNDIAVPVREIFRDHDNTFVLMGEVVRIDKEGQFVEMRDKSRLAYDYLILSPGARHSYFGHPEWEAIAPGLKTLEDALFIREKILLSFEKAERCACAEDAEAYLNFVVIGGGPTGVELSGAIAEIAFKTVAREYKRVNTSKTKVTLVEAAPCLLHTYPAKLSARVKKDLERLGVRVELKKLVTKVTPTGVHFGDEFLPTRNVIWAAGNQASPLLKTLGAPLDRQGRAVVAPDLSLPGYPNVFVIGDAACVAFKDSFLPATAPVAMQQGRFVAKLISTEAAAKERPAFKYLDKGSMAVVGLGKAVAWTGKLQMTGWMAWLAWAGIHILFLIGFRNRVGVILDWLLELVTGGRRSRAIHAHLDSSADDAAPRVIHPHEEARSC